MSPLHAIALVAVGLSALALVVALYAAIQATRFCLELKREREHRDATKAPTGFFDRWEKLPQESDMPINRFVPWKPPNDRA